MASLASAEKKSSKKFIFMMMLQKIDHAHDTIMI